MWMANSLRTSELIIRTLILFYLRAVLVVNYHGFWTLTGHFNEHDYFDLPHFVKSPYWNTLSEKPLLQNNSLAASIRQGAAFLMIFRSILTNLPQNGNDRAIMLMKWNLGFLYWLALSGRSCFGFDFENYYNHRLMIENGLPVWVFS